MVKEPLSEEAARRGLTVDACRRLLTPSPPPTSNPSARNDSGTGKQRAFLEAALYFLTNVDADASRGDVIDTEQIALGRYPAVIYLVNGNPCAVRLRTTTMPYTIWQMDFCKITYVQRRNTYGGPAYYWNGYKTALCTHKGWDKNENYTGAIDEQECMPEQNKMPRYEGEKGPNIYLIYTSVNNIDTLFGDRPSQIRSAERMMASFKYIQTLLTGKPY